MATANFHSRLQRIQSTQQQSPAPQAAASFRAPGVAGVAASQRIKRRRRHPVKDHFKSTIFGAILGCLVAVALLGLSLESAPWGPGTDLNQLVYYPAMGGLALAPVLMVLSLVLASRKPGFALFSLGYLSGIMVPLFI